MAVAGDGPESARLLELRTQLDLAQDVHFLGERADATRLMQASDFLVLCSWQEGLSNALIEAMLAGCPVIATAVGGNVELVEHARNGLLVPVDDPASLAEAIGQLCSDEPLRRTLAQQAQQSARARHSTLALAGATEAVYERALRAGRRKLPEARPTEVRQ